MQVWRATSPGRSTLHIFGNLTTNGPSGLGSVTTSTVTSGAAFALGAFIDGVAAAAAVGAQVDTWVVSPADYVLLAKLTEGTTSARPLLESDPTKPSGRVVLGTPLVISPAVASGVTWGIPRSRVYVIIRDDATVETDKSVYFTSDRIAVKATMRLGFGFAHAAAVVKISHT